MTDPSPGSGAPRTRLDMPLLLLCGMGLGAFFAMVALVAVGGILVMLPFTTQYAVNEVPATRAEFVQKSWPLLVGFPVVAGCGLAIVYALWRELPWSRRAIMSYWVASLVVVSVIAIVSGKPGDLLTSVVMAGGIIGLLSWYLYWKPSVRAYYSALRALPRNRAVGVADIRPANPMRITEVPSPEPDDLSLGFLVGRRITAIDASAAPNSWVFRFDGKGTLGVESLWRLVSEGRIVVSSEDHQKRFGLPAPIDASARALQTLDAKAIRGARFDPTTGDLTLEFANGSRLEAIVTSGGYENWALSKPDGTQLIAVGGGRVAFFRSSAAG